MDIAEFNYLSVLTAKKLGQHFDLDLYQLNPNGQWASGVYLAEVGNYSIAYLQPETPNALHYGKGIHLEGDVGDDFYYIFPHIETLDDANQLLQFLKAHGAQETVKRFNGIKH